MAFKKKQQSAYYIWHTECMNNKYAGCTVGQHLCTDGKQVKGHACLCSVPQQMWNGWDRDEQISVKGTNRLMGQLC